MNEQVLLVEDCTEVRQLLREALCLAGYRVTEAGNGRDALRQMTADTPDLLLLDIGLPDLSGWDILWLLRLSERWRHLPVVVLTGLSDSASKAYGWQLGITCYLVKPVDLNDLQLVIRKVLTGNGPTVAQQEHGLTLGLQLGAANIKTT